MPTSEITQISQITELISYTAPRKILDIGIGGGKYAFLSREYLDQPYMEQPVHTVIHGVEAFPQYIRSLHSMLYDHIFIGDFARVKEQIDSDYDLILFIDVIEHFTKEEGLELIRFLLQRGKNLVIATPDGFVEQDEVFDNPYEIHKSGWSRSDFREFGDKFFLYHDFQLIVYLGADSRRVKSAMSGAKRFYLLKQLFPFIKRPIRKLMAAVKG